MTLRQFHIHGRDAEPVPDVLRVDSFPYATLMGDWHIVGSSLPLWKGRSDVLCRYTPHDIPSAEMQARFHAADDTANGAKSGASRAAAKNVNFSDEIWWEQLDKRGKHQPGKGAQRSKRSIVRGRNKIDPKGVNSATFLWRGYNFLKPFTSHWQILAHSDNFITPPRPNAAEDSNAGQVEDGGAADKAAQGPIWLVTYFTATLFTEAGIDLYVRGTLSDSAYDEIVEALKSFQGEGPAAKELRELAGKMFKVPVGNI